MRRATYLALLFALALLIMDSTSPKTTHSGGGRAVAGVSVGR